jgi:fatty acid desaturase
VENTELNISTETTTAKPTKKVEQTKDGIELKSLLQYQKELKKELDPSFFEREPSRIKYMVGWVAVIAAGLYFAKDAHIVIQLLVGWIIGLGLGANAFIGHEVLHGAIFKNRKLQNIAGYVGFLPFMISPTYWRFWHNNLHHGNTQLLYKDPDAFPTKMVWNRSKFMKWVFKLSPGSGYLRSYTYFFFWFSLQAFLNQVYMRFGNKMWEKMNHGKVTVEFISQILIVAAYVNWVGIEGFIPFVVIPFMTMNYTVMSYISTNHNMNPYTRVNDPLVNSLTVTNSKVWEFVHVNFGYHVEHHLFQNIPASRNKKLSEILRAKYPDRYLIMPKRRAVKLLYNTPRIYKNREELVHPVSGKVYPTLTKKELELQ